MGSHSLSLTHTYTQTCPPIKLKLEILFLNFADMPSVYMGWGFPSDRKGPIRGICSASCLGLMVQISRNTGRPGAGAAKEQHHSTTLLPQLCGQGGHVPPGVAWKGYGGIPSKV